MIIAEMPTDNVLIDGVDGVFIVHLSCPFITTLNLISCDRYKAIIATYRGMQYFRLMMSRRLPRGILDADINSN